MKEVSTFLCYEATADLMLESCDVKTCVSDEKGQHIAERVGIVPVLRGGLGMVESMTEMVSNAQVWHLGIYRDKTSLLPIEYYNKLPKKVTVHTVFVLDPMPISGATAVAAMDILKAWGESLKPQRTLKIKFICLVASSAAIQFITDAHPDVPIHVGLVDSASVRRTGGPRLQTMPVAKPRTRIRSLRWRRQARRGMRQSSAYTHALGATGAPVDEPSLNLACRLLVQPRPAAMATSAA